MTCLHGRSLTRYFASLQKVSPDSELITLCDGTHALEQEIYPWFASRRIPRSPPGQ